MGKIIYRPHRGSLQEALEHKKEFESEEAMKEYIFREAKKFSEEIGRAKPPFEVGDIVILEESMDDTRCGWHDTRYVCIKQFGEDDYMEKYGSPQCIGMCATNYEKD